LADPTFGILVNLAWFTNDKSKSPITLWYILYMYA